MKRVPSHELLDSDSGTPTEVAGTLRDLRDMNRWLGGISTTQRMIEKIARPRKLQSVSLLEVAAGSGENPRAVSARLNGLGINVNYTLLDRASTHLSALPNGSNRRQAVVGNALALPFKNKSFDVVSCCLFVHHLSPDEVVTFLNEALRVCRIAVLINDLVRTPLHLAAANAGTLIYRSRITRNDAPASVRQAYTIQEMQDLVAKSSAARSEIHARFFFRMAVTAWPS